ncbi:TorF family putative porin [Tsuneonella sp. HG249]
MLTSIRGAFAASVIAASLTAAPAFGQEEEAPSSLTVTGNVTLVSDYRFRGVSLSGGDPALQGAITVTHDSGFYLGNWASSIDDGGTDFYGDVEVDIFGGWTGDVSEGVGLDVGLLYYAYPSNASGVDAEFFEPYATVIGTLGPVTAKVGANYAWDQKGIADDSLYLRTDLSAGIPNTPVSLNAHLGYTDGAFSFDPDGESFDWSLGATATVLGSLTLGVSYVGVEAPSVNNLTDDAVVFSVGASF